MQMRLGILFNGVVPRNSAAGVILETIFQEACG
jgi:hypothetical protein